MVTVVTGDWKLCLASNSQEVCWFTCEGQQDTVQHHRGFCRHLHMILSECSRVFDHGNRKVPPVGLVVSQVWTTRQLNGHN